jgi:hypothetical protein
MTWKLKAGMSTNKVWGMGFVVWGKGECIRLPSWERAKRKEFALWANLAKEPACRVGGGFIKDKLRI